METADASMIVKRLLERLADTGPNQVTDHVGSMTWWIGMGMGVWMGKIYFFSHLHTHSESAAD